MLRFPPLRQALIRKRQLIQTPKMANRILKDIRFCESEKQNIDGQSMPSELGKLFIPTEDTNYIGQRIARKLNELQYSYGEFDHIYINLTTFLKENEVIVSKRNIDKRIKYLDYGIRPENIQALSDNEKNSFIKAATFKLLKQISTDPHLELVKQTEKLIAEFDTEIKINYKTKETGNYKVDISYQINPIGSSTGAIVEYLDKKDNLKYQGYIQLQFYEDIYPLVNTITVKDNFLVFNPKKSFRADLYNNRYKTPIKLNIAGLDRL